MSVWAMILVIDLLIAS